MDEICVFIDKIADLVCRSSKSPACYAALCRGRSFNRPSPLAGFMFQAKGDYGVWRIGDEPWRLPTNYLSIGCCHKGSASSEPVKPVELWAVAFDLGEFSEFDYLWEAPIRTKTVVSDPCRLVETFQKTAARFINNETEPLFLKAALLELCAIVKIEFTRDYEKTRPVSVEKALRWMDHHYHNPDVTLRNIADSSGLSLHHFGRTFKRHMGTSAMSFLKELRIRHGGALLRGTSLRVNEIAFEVGFHDPLHFSRVFHSITGQTPRSFRTDNPAKQNRL